MAKILIIDDSPADAKLLAFYLAQNDLEPLIANSGEAGMAAISRDQPDAILLDVMMPGISGYEVCTQLANHPHTSRIPVIMVSGRDDADDVVRGLEAGACDYITKPFHPRMALARVRAALRTKHACDEAHQLNQMLGEARREAEGAARGQIEFLTNVSHELRTPITAMLGYVELLSEGFTEPEQPTEAADWVKSIRRNGEHLLGVVDDILTMSKLEAGRVRIESVRCSPTQLVDDIMLQMRGRAESKGLALNVEYLGSIPMSIRTDPPRLRQILINLLGNAIKFTQNGGVRLIMRSTRDESNRLVQFDIVDSGPGVHDSNREAIFRPFGMADSSTRREHGGTGLGLALCKRLARMMGGDVELVATVLGSGSQFRLTIETGPLQGVPCVDYSFACPGPRSEVMAGA